MFQGKLYYVLLLFCWMYALLKGGPPERIGATILVVGSTLTVAALPHLDYRFGSVELGVVLTDILTFAACLVLTLRADRLWPIWMSALVGVGALGHLGRWYAGSDLGSWTYAVSISIWGYPILVTIAIGTLHHQRRAARPREPASRGRT